MFVISCVCQLINKECMMMMIDDEDDDKQQHNRASGWLKLTEQSSQLELSCGV